MAKLFLAFLGIILLLAVPSERAGAQDQAGARERTVISALPRNGHFQQTMDAMRMAAAELNANLSNVLDWRFNLVEDERSPMTGNSQLAAFDFVLTRLQQSPAVTVLGVMSLSSVESVAAIAKPLNLPVITTSLSRRKSWTRTLLPTLLYARPAHSQLPYATKDLLSHFSWRKFCAVCSLDFSSLAAFEDLIETVAPKYDIQVLLSANARFDGNGNVSPVTLQALRGFQSECSVIVVGVKEPNLLAFMRAASSLGLVRDGSAWIFIDMLTGPELLSPELQQYIEGSLVLRHRSPGGDYGRLLTFAENLNKFSPSGAPCNMSTVDCISVESAYAYDAMKALEIALKVWTADEHAPSSAKVELHKNVSLSSLTDGRSLVRLLERVSFSGVMGTFTLTGSDDEVEYDIFNVRNARLTRVGYWTQSQFLSNIDPVVWTGRSNKIPEARVLANDSLQVLVPMSAPFTFLYHDPPRGNEDFGGVAIDVLRTLADNAGFNYTLTAWRRTWDEMITVAGDTNNEYDMAIGSITVKADRALRCNFTRSIFLTGLRMLVLRPEEEKSGFWDFLLPFHWSVWLTFAITVLFSAAVMMVLDKDGVNTERTGHAYFDSLFFTTNVFLFVHEADVIVKKWARAFLVVLQFSMLILLAAYTANMATFLSNQQTEIEIQSYADLFRYPVVGRGGTTNWVYIQDELGLQNVVNVTSGEHAIRALRSSQADAYIADSPHIENIAANECDLVVVGNQVGQTTEECSNTKIDD